MSSIGILVNPFSGKDLRRITSYATLVGDTEKERKVVRMVNSMKKLGVDKVYLMPDNYCLNQNIATICNQRNNSHCCVEILDLIPTDQPEDTIKAAEMMRIIGIDCLIVLGGDGTNRLVAKVGLEVPVIPVSTGTNNAYPKMWEGTTVGIAASYLSEHRKDFIIKRDKRIDISVNGRFTDVALVDAVLTDIPFVGSKVVPGITAMKEIIVCRCSPDVIGFSSIIGNLKVCTDQNDFGYRLKISGQGKKMLSSINSGENTEITYSGLTKMNLGQEYSVKLNYSGTVALDGERTLPFKQGDEIQFTITRNGLFKVNVQEILIEAVKNHFFEFPKQK